MDDLQEMECECCLQAGFPKWTSDCVVVCDDASECLERVKSAARLA